MPGPTLSWNRASVVDFIARFEACRVPRAEWTHTAHLVAGYWYVTEQGADAALDTLRERIRRHNESVGTPNSDQDGYHETITRLYVTAIARHVAVQRGLDFEEGLRSLLKSRLADSRWPLTLYSEGRLFSVRARHEWVEPDRGWTEQEGKPWPADPG